MFGRRDRHGEARVRKLLDQAKGERFLPGREEAALGRQEEAADLIRSLTARHPDDPRHQQQLASTLYTLASMRTEAGQPDTAVAACDESEELYRALGARPGAPDTRPYVADVRVRRGVALAAGGRGASAVPEAGSAVTAYEELAGDDPGHPHARDLARVLAGNAMVLAPFGDPDLAVASADRALRFYLSGRPTPGAFAIQAEDRSYLVQAGAIAATVHAEHARIEISVAAALLALQFVDPAMLASLQEVSARVDRMTAGERLRLGERVAAALRQRAGDGPLPPPVEPGDPDVSVLLKVLHQLRLTALRAPVGRAAAVDHELRVTTLAAALDRADGEGDAVESLARAVTRPAIECVIAAPAHRCPPQLAPAYALQLAELAPGMLAAAPVAGLRIGLEAHYLFAAASEQQVLAMRYQFQDFGPAWARVLLACSAVFQDRGNPVMALDLAAWAGGVAQQLMPFALLDRPILELVRDCLERHAGLLLAAGDQQAGEQVLAAVRSLDELSPGG